LSGFDHLASNFTQPSPDNLREEFYTAWGRNRQGFTLTELFKGGIQLLQFFIPKEFFGQTVGTEALADDQTVMTEENHGCK